MRPWTDQRVEELIGNLLQVGVTSASAVVLLGGVIYLLRHGLEIPRYHDFVGEPGGYRTLGGIVRGTFSGRGRGIIQLGLLLLIVTPVARVAFALAAFALERDRLYVIVSLLVLAILLYSLLSRQP